MGSGHRPAPFIFLLLLLVASPCAGVETWHELPAARAMNSDLGRKKLNPGVKLFMKGQPHPGVAKRIGEYKTNRRTNTFKKTKERACEIAFLSALIALQGRAVREGGNAVIDIYSITKYQRYESTENYRCLTGKALANVALMGTVVKLD